MKSGLFLAMAVLLLPAIAFSQEVGSIPAETGPAWSPYVAGGLIGLLSVFTFYFSQKPLGASTAYARVAGLAGKMVAPRHTENLEFYEKKEPKIDWEVMLVTGIIIGAFLAAFTGGEITGRWLPPMWIETFGASIVPRLIIGTAGGILMAFGARLAGGCTSGHGISGTLQLSVSSWIAVICFFIGGAATAFLLYRF